MKPLSAKLSGVPKSSIRKLFDLLGAQKDTISLGIGQPDFPAPQVVIDATIAALKEGKGSVYAPTMGIPQLKSIIAEKLKKENHVIADPDKNVMVTNGGSGSITLVLWNDQIETVKAGAKIKIENGYVNEWQGASQLTLGKFGKLTVL